MVMRDLNRIEAYCKWLAEVWKELPDWRLGQLMVNFIDCKGGPLAFYMEDEDFMIMLEKFVKEIKHED
jgi:hypothetical protein